MSQAEGWLGLLADLRPRYTKMRALTRSFEYVIASDTWRRLPSMTVAIVDSKVWDDGATAATHEVYDATTAGGRTRLRCRGRGITSPS